MVAELVPKNREQPVPFVDPKPGIRAEYEAALQRLKLDFGRIRSREDRRRFRREVRRLKRRYLPRPYWIAHWAR